MSNCAACHWAHSGVCVCVCVCVQIHRVVFVFQMEKGVCVCVHTCYPWITKSETCVFVCVCVCVCAYCEINSAQLIRLRLKLRRGHSWAHPSFLTTSLTTIPSVFLFPCLHASFLLSFLHSSLPFFLCVLIFSWSFECISSRLPVECIFFLQHTHLAPYFSLPNTHIHTHTHTHARTHTDGAGITSFLY